MWEKLGETTDLLVIGGGITGAGIARDAARRGLSVTLVEMRDFAYGTSSRSSKLVHGGLRYLETYEFSLVFEAVSERRILLDIAPHIVNPLAFLFPVYDDSRRGLGTITAGMWLYEGLALFRSPKRPRRLNPKDLKREEISLQQEGLKGASLYYDCSTDDARLTLETALDAAAAGATVLPWAKVTEFIRGEDGRLCGAKIQDVAGGPGRPPGEERELRARVVVSATGPWTDEVRAMATAEAAPLLRPTKGVHIVVKQEVLPIAHAVVCFHPVDDRVLFAIPWGDRTYLGTTDTDYEGRPEDVAATAEDVSYLIQAAIRYFPDHPIRPKDVIATWAGLRPLIAEEATPSQKHKGQAAKSAAAKKKTERSPQAPQESEGELDESMVSREHRIVVDASGLITIAGGKLTTYRRMAAEVVDTALRMLRVTGGLPERELEPARTDVTPLPGAVGWPDDDDHERVARQVMASSGGYLESSSARLLSDTYGMLALDIATKVRAQPEMARALVEGRPEILAQVDHAVLEEMASTVDDVMRRRTQLYFRDEDQGLSALPLVAARMQTLLSWSDEKREEEIVHYQRQVERSRDWRKEWADLPGSAKLSG